MILSTPEELNALLPANVSTRPDRLLTLVEQTERTHIIPLLGKELYAEVCAEYAKLFYENAVDADGNPISVNDMVAVQVGSQAPSYTPMQQLIRLLQVPLVYMTLADNTAILSVSLNDGGMNIVSAESYDAAKKDDREAFSRDCYRNAHKGMDQVLLFLEEDALSANPVFLAAWSKSATFYWQSDLLVPNAIRFSQFVPINDSRELFLQLVPRIRYIQDSKLRPELGETLVNAMVQYAVLGPQPGGQLASADSVQDRNAFEEDLRQYLPLRRSAQTTTEQLIKLRGWNRLLLLLQTAVCFYTEMDSKKLRRPDSDKDAMLSLERAKQFISANTELFEGVIEDSPLFIPAPSSPSPAPQQGSGNGVVFDPLGSYYP